MNDIPQLEHILRDDHLRRAPRGLSVREALIAALSRDDVVLGDQLLIELRTGLARDTEQQPSEQILRAARAKVAKGLTDDLTRENCLDEMHRGLYDLYVALDDYLRRYG